MIKNVLEYSIHRYCDEETDLCKLHKVPDDDVAIDGEFKRLQSAFTRAFPRLKNGKDYEFPDWHHNLRLFWVYLYHDDFYTREFIPLVQKLIQAAPRSWFAQFECYSPASTSPDSNPNGYVGQFLVYKDTVMLQTAEYWPEYKQKLGI